MQILVTTMSGKEYWIDPDSVKVSEMSPDDGVYLKNSVSDTFMTISPYGVESVRVFKNDDRIQGLLWVAISAEEFDEAVSLV
jgi:hypothetical protein